MRVYVGVIKLRHYLFMAVIRAIQRNCMLFRSIACYLEALHAISRKLRALYGHYLFMTVNRAIQRNCMRFRGIACDLEELHAISRKPRALYGHVNNDKH